MYLSIINTGCESMDLENFVCDEFGFTPIAVGPSCVGVAIDLMDFETHLIPVDGFCRVGGCCGG